MQLQAGHAGTCMTASRPHAGVFITAIPPHAGACKDVKFEVVL